MLDRHHSFYVEFSVGSGSAGRKKRVQQMVQEWFVQFHKLLDRLLHFKTRGSGSHTHEPD